MYCIVLNCQTPSRAKGRSSCRIPAVITNQGEEAQRLSEERRRLWLAAINRGELTESALKHGRVCGSHFVSGKAAPPWNRASVDWVPTLNLRHQTLNVDGERAQERAWRRFAKRRRKEARHDHIEAQKTEEKSSSGVQRGGDTTVRSTSKRVRVSNSLQGDGVDSYAAGDHGSEGDSTPPMMGVLGFSKKTTLALLNRMFAEELLSELERRNIEVKLAGGDRPRGRDDLEHVLREVMTREYEEVEGGNVNMDMSNTSSTSQHGCSNTSSSLEHEAGSSEVLSRPHDDQATTHDIQEPSVKATDMDVSETSSTTSVQVKKEPVEDDFEYCVATSSHSSDSVASTTEPSTSQTQNPSGVKGGCQRRSPRRAQKLAVRIKTEPSVEEETEDEQQDLRSEHCPSSPGQLSQELDQVEVSTEEEDTKPSSAEPVKTMATHQMLTWPKRTRGPAWSREETRALVKFLSLPSEVWDPTQSNRWPQVSGGPLWSKAAHFVKENARSSILRHDGSVRAQVSKHLQPLYPIRAGGRRLAEKVMEISALESHTGPRTVTDDSSVCRESLSCVSTQGSVDAGPQTEEKFFKPHLPEPQKMPRTEPQRMSTQVLKRMPPPEPQGMSTPIKSTSTRTLQSDVTQ